MGASFSATPGSSSTTILPRASTGSSLSWSSRTRVPPRSRNNPLFPVMSAIRLVCRWPSSRGAPVQVIANVREDFVEDRHAGLGLFFADDQRRIDPDTRKVGHGDDSAAQRFQENLLGHPAA